MSLPKDPMILLSYVNTQLRDHYHSLEEFCAAQNIDRKALETALGEIDYEYDATRNAFV